MSIGHGTDTGLGGEGTGRGRPAIRRIDADSRRGDLAARGAAAGGTGRRDGRACRRVEAAASRGESLHLRGVRLFDRDATRLRAWPGLLRQQPRHAGRRRGLYAARAVRRWLHRSRQRLPGLLQLGRWLRGLLHRLLRQPRRLRHAAEPQRDLHERNAESVPLRAGLLPVRAGVGGRRGELRVYVLSRAPAWPVSASIGEPAQRSNTRAGESSSARAARAFGVAPPAD